MSDGVTRNSAHGRQSHPCPDSGASAIQPPTVAHAYKPGGTVHPVNTSTAFLRTF